MMVEKMFLNSPMTDCIFIIINSQKQRRTRCPIIVLCFYPLMRKTDKV